MAFRAISIALIFGVAASSAETPREALLVLSKSEHTLSIVDPTSLQVVARCPVGEDPHEVIASTDGTRAYVSNYGGGAYNTLALIDLVGQKALPSIDLGALRGPHGLTFAGGKTWFTAEGAKAIGRYDPQSGKVDWILGTGQDRTHMIYVSSDTKHIVTTNVSSATVSLIDYGAVNRRPPGPPPKMPSSARRLSARPPMGPSGDWEQTIFAVGKGSEGFDVSPDGKEIWVANAGDGTVTVIDVAQKKVSDTLQVNANGANRLKFTPDGKRVLIACLGAGGVLVMDAASHKEVKRFEAGGGAAGIQMRPDGKVAYVAHTGGDYVGVIDLTSLQESGRIDAGKEPDGMAWATRSK